MIFINTRPVDENAQCERRPSKAPSHTGHAHHQDGSHTHLLRLSMSLMLFYILVSIFPCILFYPISLVSLFVPILALFFALCSMRSDYYNTQWPILFIAVIGILLKIAAIVVYISIFPLKDNRRPASRTQKTEAEMKHYRTIFYIILTTVEFFILVVGICLKWQLVTLQEKEHLQKRRATLTSNRSLIGEDSGQRRSIQQV